MMTEQELASMERNSRNGLMLFPSDVRQLIAEVRRLNQLVRVAREGLADLNTRIGAAIALTKDESKDGPCCDCDS